MSGATVLVDIGSLSTGDPQMLYQLSTVREPTSTITFQVDKRTLMAWNRRSPIEPEVIGATYARPEDAELLAGEMQRVIARMVAELREQLLP